jgi:peptidoglycan/LPS O-acetylase OafA/YrhL
MRLFRLGRNQWDRTAALGLAVLGVVALVGGWYGASRSVFAFEQVPFVISGGFAGLSLIVVAASSWISADLRDEWRKLDRLEEAVTAISSPRPGEAGPPR